MAANLHMIFSHTRMQHHSVAGPQDRPAMEPVDMFGAEILDRPTLNTYWSAPIIADHDVFLVDMVIRTRITTVRIEVDTSDGHLAPSPRPGRQLGLNDGQG